MKTVELRSALTALRIKTAATAEEAASVGIGDILSSARRGAGHVWDSANKGTQAMAEHLESVKAPKILSGAVHALPVGLAAYGGYRVLKGLNDWNNNRTLQNQMGGGY